MNKKILLLSKPPRYVAATHNTYIVTYDFNRDGEKIRYRNSFDLGRIKCDKKRAVAADKIIKMITDHISSGGYYEEMSILHHAPKIRKQMPVIGATLAEVMELARNEKCNSTRKQTNATYKSQINCFLKWAKSKGYNNKIANHFNSAKAYEYLDYYKNELKVRNSTYNNILICQNSIWNFLESREHVQKNPFNKIKPLRKEPKMRRNFSRYESEVVLNEIAKEDRVLFYAVILMYACLIRGAEMRRMRFHQIDIENGLIFLEAHQTKNHKESVITIPSNLLDIFKEAFLE